MAYLKQVRGHENDRTQLNRQQVKLATQVFAGHAVVDPYVFRAMPHTNDEVETEADGSMTEFKDVMTTFSAAVYGKIYGRASSGYRVRRNTSMVQAVMSWNNAVNAAYSSAITPAVYRRMFFGGGLWRVFIDHETMPEDKWRERLEATQDFSPFTRKRGLLADIIDQTYPHFGRFSPGQQPSHAGSHWDAAVFGRTVLNIGETELGISGDDNKAELLANSLPELRRIALLEILGCNLAVGAFHSENDNHERFRREFLSVDEYRPHVGFNMPAIQDFVESELPDVSSFNHRGCPALYQVTEFNGHTTPIFHVMEQTLVRMYQETGALSISGLR